jgi:ACR3 family arsenite transporter
VWSYLTNGDPAYTLVQVSLNDLIMLVLFAPIVRLLVSGASSLSVPLPVLLWSVLLFIAVRLAPITLGALIVTVVLIFSFQADNITSRLLHVALIAVPITLQVYFNASLAYWLMHRLRVPFSIAAPGALIGASNFFELAVATAIALFGPESGAALATVVGVLVEVPVMLSVCSACNRTRGWFPAPEGAAG